MLMSTRGQICTIHCNNDSYNPGAELALITRNTLTQVVICVTSASWHDAPQTAQSESQLKQQRLAHELSMVHRPPVCREPFSSKHLRNSKTKPRSLLLAPVLPNTFETRLTDKTGTGVGPSRLGTGSLSHSSHEQNHSKRRQYCHDNCKHARHHHRV